VKVVDGRAVTKIKHCPEDGGEVRPVKVAGRLYRHYTMLLELPEDIAVPTCARCGSEYVDRELGARIDKALAARYRDAPIGKAQNALESLSTEVRQNRLEALVGVSHGYLSKLRNGDKEPSPHMVALLKLLANDPHRIVELEDAWGETRHGLRQ
jgi:hypothetical protein